MFSNIRQIMMSSGHMFGEMTSEDVSRLPNQVVLKRLKQALQDVGFSVPDAEALTLTYKIDVNQQFIDNEEMASCVIKGVANLSKATYEHLSTVFSDPMTAMLEMLRNGGANTIQYG